MGSRYPGRPETSNKTAPIGVRLPEYQRNKLQKYAGKYKMSLSDIMREALAIWFNMNGGEVK